jgi:hypothetical protein
MTHHSATLVPRRAWAAVLLAAALWIAIPAPASAGEAPSLTPAQWREDLRFAMQKIRDVHPMPYRRIKADSLELAVRNLDRIIPELSDDQVVTNLMRLVSKIQDGQTAILPWYSSLAGGPLFPLRFRQFSDGLFITEAPKGNADLAGAEVLQVGKVAAQEAFERVSGLLSYDNSFTRLERGPKALVTPAIVHGVGLTGTRDTLEVTVRTRKGARRTERIAAVPDESGTDWLWKEEGLPVPESVSAIDGVSEFPVTRHRDQSYWFAYLPDHKVLYVQLNAVKNDKEESFERFCGRMWQEVDQKEVEKLILDVRGNEGGMSGLLKPLLHGVIKRDSINRTGRFLMLTGRKTSGAAVDCQAFLEEHTNVLFVGEPSGASPNHADDPGRYVLPQSGLTLNVSKFFWTNSMPWDKRAVIQPQIPVTVSSKDYFAGRDPVYEAAVALEDYKSLPDLLRESASGGLAKTRAAYREYRKRYPEGFGETPEREINYLGYVLMSEGDVDEAIVVFRLNAELFPESWNVWDSLGEGLMAKGDTAGAIANYEKSVKMNPENTGGKAMLRSLRESDPSALGKK